MDRVAASISAALWDLSKEQNFEIVAVSPHLNEGDVAEVLGRQIPVISSPRTKGYLWEQASIYRLEPESWLLSFCNMGPIFRKRQVLMVHDSQVYEQPAAYKFSFRLLYKLLQPIASRNSRVLLTVSDFSKSSLEKFRVFPKDSGNVVHNGVDHMAHYEQDPLVFRAKNLTKGRYFLAIGSNASHKNLDLLYQIFDQRPSDSLPLVVVGAAKSKVLTSGKVGRSENVIHIGRVSDSELSALLHHARSFLFPSLTEGFGLPPLEAMACGCPVIASTGGAIPEVCGDAAILLDPSDVPKWAETIAAFESDDSLIEQYSQKGRIRAADFVWKETAREILKLIIEEEEKF